MVSKTIVAVMLVSALAILPGSSALNADVEIPSLDPSPATNVAVEGIAEVNAQVEKVKEQVDETLDCQLLAKVPVYVQYGDESDVRTSDRAFLTDRVFTTIAEVQVPVYGSVTRTVLGQVGALDGAVPVTEEVTEIVGYETQEVVTTDTVTYRVDVTWDEQLMQWTQPEKHVFFMPVASAALFMDDGASIEHVCEDVEVLDALPSFHRNGHDRVRWSIGWKWYAEETWYMTDYDYTVREAKAADSHLPKRQAFNFCPVAVTEAIQSHLDELTFTPKTNNGDQSGSDADVQTGEAALVAPSSSFAMIGVLIAGVLALVGLVGYDQLKRRK